MWKAYETEGMLSSNDKVVSLRCSHCGNLEMLPNKEIIRLLCMIRDNEGKAGRYVYGSAMFSNLLIDVASCMTFEAICSKWGKLLDTVKGVVGA